MMMADENAGAARGEGGGVTGEDRASVMGVASLGTALVSVCACVVAALVATMAGHPGAAVVVFVLPVLGIAAVVMGAVALAKDRARRRRGGGAAVPFQRGPAAFGVIIGLASAVLQGSVAAGALMSYVPVKQNLVPVMSAMIGEWEKGNTDRALGAIVETSRNVVDGARLDGFLRTVEGAVGRPAHANVGIDIFLKSRAVFAEAARRGGAQGTAPDLLLQVKALEVVGPKGTVVVYVVLDDAALKQDRVRIADALAVLPGGKCAVVLPEGRMKQMGEWLGMEEVVSDE